jgi:hypothetical protein
MGETKDCSQGFDFSEVLKDAVGNLPPENLDNESRFTVAVTRIVGSFSSAIGLMGLFCRTRQLLLTEGSTITIN